MLAELNSVVVPPVAESVLAPVSWELIWPPVETTAAVSWPLCSVPPWSATLLIVCAVPERSSTPLTTVCEAALNLPAPPIARVPVVTDVTPV